MKKQFNEAEFQITPETETDVRDVRIRALTRVKTFLDHEFGMEPYLYFKPRLGAVGSLHYSIYGDGYGGEEYSLQIANASRPINAPILYVDISGPKTISLNFHMNAADGYDKLATALEKHYGVKSLREDISNKMSPKTKIIKVINHFFNLKGFGENNEYQLAFDQSEKSPVYRWKSGPNEVLLISTSTNTDGSRSDHLVDVIFHDEDRIIINKMMHIDVNNVDDLDNFIDWVSKYLKQKPKLDEGKFNEEVKTSKKFFYCENNKTNT